MEKRTAELCKPKIYAMFINYSVLLFKENTVKLYSLARQGGSFMREAKRRRPSKTCTKLTKPQNDAARASYLAGTAQERNLFMITWEKASNLFA
jgi:hypothetical protein